MPQLLGGVRRGNCGASRLAYEIDLAQFVIDHGAVGNWRPADGVVSGRLIESA